MRRGEGVTTKVDGAVKSGLVGEKPRGKNILEFPQQKRREESQDSQQDQSHQNHSRFDTRFRIRLNFLKNGRAIIQTDRKSKSGKRPSKLQKNEQIN
jgi:hypothetical protein